MDLTRVLWFHPRPLLPAWGGGERRTSGLIGAALDAGHEVLVVQPGPLGESPPEGLLVLELGLRTGVGRALAKLSPPDPLRAARVPRRELQRAREAVAAFEPEVAVVGEVFSWVLARRLIPASVPWVYDAHNVESDLFRSLAATAPSRRDRTTLAVDARRVARAERTLLERADAVTAVSTGDAARLHALRAAVDPVVVPSSVPVPDPGRPADKPVVLFVGSLDYPPNVEALTDLVRVVMPTIREQVPEARLLVAGRRPVAPLRALLEDASWVDFREDLPRIDDAYRAARLTVIPIRSGSGTRLKVYEALAFGIPVVGTTAAVAGVPRGDGVVTVADDPGALADAAVHLLRDTARVADLGERSRRLFLDELSWAHAAPPMLGLLERLAARASA